MGPSAASQGNNRNLERAEQTGVQWTRAGLAVLPWLAPASACILLKLDLFVSHTKWVDGGFDLLRHHLGIVEFTGYQRLAFFRNEILVVFVLVPACLLLVYRCLPVRGLALIAGILNAAVFSVLFAERMAVSAVGSFISLDMLWTAYLWGKQDPSARSEYLPAGAVAEYAVGMGLIVALAWWGARKQRHLARGEGRNCRNAFLAAAIYLPLVSAALWLVRIPPTPMQTPVLFTITRALWAGGDVDTREFGGLTPAQLRTRYEELANAPRSLPSSFYGRAPGYNVLYFIMETAPARCVPLDSDPGAYPNLVLLRRHAFVATAHHATFLHTTANLFSIFSSWYPSSLGKSFADEHPDRRVPGLVRELIAAGYEAGVYSPVRSQYAVIDEPIFATLGFPPLHYPHPGAEKIFPRVEDKLADDRATLELLKSDLRQWTSAKKRFVAVFLPQIGHAPWPDLRSGGSEKNIVRRGQAVVSVEDQWIGEIIGLLRETAALEHTLIVVTGDHGVRTHVEDPALQEGMLDDYSYHVPLLIYAPGVLARTETVPWVTSHVDIAPTIADLLGLRTGREGEQGTAIWNAQLSGRTTYLFGRSYAGADGYHRGGRFYMRNYLYEQSYSSSQLHFAAQDAVTANSAVDAEVRSTIARMTALQQIWLARSSIAGKQDDLPMAHR